MPRFGEIPADKLRDVDEYVLVELSELLSYVEELKCPFAKSTPVTYFRGPVTDVGEGAAAVVEDGTELFEVAAEL
jgi:hypothetical protein